MERPAQSPQGTRPTPVTVFNSRPIRSAADLKARKETIISNIAPLQGEEVSFFTERETADALALLWNAMDMGKKADYQSRTHERLRGRIRYRKLFHRCEREIVSIIAFTLRAGTHNFKRQGVIYHQYEKDILTTLELENLINRKLGKSSKIQEKEDNGLVPWPSDVPKRRLIHSNYPCDMWTGPCSCGAWHTEGK